MLGGFTVSVGARTIEEGEWRLRKAAGLVKLLALQPAHRLHREQLMDVLWPDLDEKAQANNLRYALHHARQTLESASTGTSRLLRLQGDLLELGAEGPLSMDVEVFEEAARMARRSRDVGAYRAALDLYAGDLLPQDSYEVWTEDRREELRRTHLSLLSELAALHEERGEFEPAIEALRWVLAREPSHEEAHVHLMRLYALYGRRGEALEQYERLREALKCEHATEPSAESRCLYEEIRTERSPLVRWPRQAEEGPREEPQHEEEDSRKHNLPVALTTFVGREQELLEIKRELAMSRLLTLIGAGGSGKTRLALEVARDLVGAYPDGSWFVELAPLAEGGLVPQAVAAALSVKERPDRPLSATLADALQPRQMLLVLDNCEHLVDAVARLTETLLESCPGLRVLATSREALGTQDEVNWTVPPLSGPDPQRQQTLEEIAGYESVRLFVQRARSRDSTFVLFPENAQIVAEICERLDGIPLAIELAAARVGTLTVQQIYERLGDALELLTGDRRTVTRRQRTLRGALDWSHELLSEPERMLFRRLSVFAGGWTVEAAEAVGVGSGIEEGEVLALLSQLVERSLVTTQATGGGGVRFRMLEPVRQYAQERLEEHGKAAAVRRRHAEFFLALAEEAEPELLGPRQEVWLECLEREHDNLRAALRWLLDERVAELTLRVAGALWLFWFMRGYSLEGWRWLEESASLGGPLAPRAKALKGAGWVVMFRGDIETAKELLEESVDLYRALKDEEGLASSLNYLGYVALLGQWEDITVADLLEEALALKLRIQNRHTIANTLLLAGLDALLLREDWDEAVTLHEEALTVFRELQDKWGICLCLTNLGLIEAALEHYARARTLLRELMHLSLKLDDKFTNQYSFFGLACVADSEGHTVRAVRLWGVAEGIREAAGLRLPPSTYYVMKYESRLDEARARLGEAAFEEAWAEGKAMTTEQSMEYALSEEESGTPSVLTPEKPPAGDTIGNLTRREQEVAVLVARGLTNRQISTELGISERTAGNHVARILRKLGLRSRAQIASWTTERQLLAPEAD
jgi:predicted ATPase/DNA-binding SARP family transcriptional activator/DNA-binding CsgD family transcriptional regulator